MNKSAAADFLFDILFSVSLMLILILPAEGRTVIYSVVAAIAAILIAKSILKESNAMHGYAILILMTPVYLTVNIITSLAIPFLMLRRGNRGIIDTISPAKADSEPKRLLYICNSYFIDNRLPLQFTGNRISVFTFAWMPRFRRRARRNASAN